MTTITITIPRTLLEQALEALDMSRRFVYQDNRPQVDAAFDALRTELAKPVGQVDNGGPAFPLQTWDAAIQSPKTETGLTLRDYFAAKAMQALLPIHREKLDFDLTKSAYRTADAMLKAREA